MLRKLLLLAALICAVPFMTAAEEQPRVLAHGWYFTPAECDEVPRGKYTVYEVKWTGHNVTMDYIAETSRFKERRKRRKAIRRCKELFSEHYIY